MAEAARIDVDESRFPLVVVTFVGRPSDAQFRAYLEQMDQIVARRETYATLLDASEVGNTPAVQRRMQAEWLKRHDATIRACSVGTAMVISRAAVRGLLTAILWLTPIPGEHQTFATFEDAERWCLDRLRAARAAGPS